MSRKKPRSKKDATPTPEAVEEPIVEELDVEESVDVVDGDDQTDELMQLQSEVDRLQDDLEAEHDRLLRTVAEMENLRKRTRREVVESRRFARADVLRAMVEVLDNFERALQHGSDDDEAPAERHQAFRDGVEMIAQSFRQALLDRGVRPIEAEGAVFDPSLHEAVGQQPAGEEVESGSVMAVVQTGYTFDDMVLRPSRVIVAQ